VVQHAAVVDTAPNLARGSGRSRHAAGIAGLAALVALAIFVDLGRPYLWDPGEGRYAETVREMLVTGNWLVPTLNFVHYYDKPPGFFWLVAASFRWFGVSEWAARLPAALCAVLTIAATVAFAWRRLGPSTALGAGAILATAIQFVILARSVRMDMALTLGVSATLFYAYTLWEHSATDGPGGKAPRATWPIYVLPTLGMLVKGPVAILLPTLVLGVFAVVTGTTRRLTRLRPGLGAVVGLLLASSWYVAAAIRAPDYLWVFLWQ
jgi:4-amino-4-deoxy-L-arabinose transferase-like glycosyltransferase